MSQAQPDDQPQSEIPSWTIPGFEGAPILGSVHTPSIEPIGVVVIVHGFLGYKDYGLFPRLARAMADAGFIAHRINLSHSGMTQQTQTFAEPELFEQDTWAGQVHDINAVVEAIASGGLDGAGLPLVLIGHSRGGVSVVLAAGGRCRAGEPPLPAGVITLSAPDRSCSWDADLREEVLEQGFTRVRSNRTGQSLRIDARWLREQLDDPQGHDVLAHIRDIACPVCVVHGEDDPTVSADAAHHLVAAAGGNARLVLVEAGDHVYQTPNPDPANAAPSAQLGVVIGACTAFARSCVRRGV